MFGPLKKRPKKKENETRAELRKIDKDALRKSEKGRRPGGVP